MTQLEYDTEYATLVAFLEQLHKDAAKVYLPDSHALYRKLERIELWFERAIDDLDKRFMKEDG